MGELRDQMVRDMDVCHFSGRTVEAYVAGVKGLAKYSMRAPDQLSDEEVQRYLLHLREERRLSSSSCNQIRCALRFFYEVTVRRPQPSLTVPPMRQAQKLPEILSREEVERIVAATSTRRERVLLMATYGGGLRVSEVVALRPTDLDDPRGADHDLGARAGAGLPRSRVERRCAATIQASRRALRRSSSTSSGERFSPSATTCFRSPFRAAAKRCLEGRRTF